MDKKLYKAGFWGYAILLVLAIIFYKERTVMLDTSFFLFYMVKDADFCIQNDRFIAAFPELIPLFARKIGASLNTISILYSISFVLYHLVCYVVCGSWLKQYRIAIALLLMHIILQTEVFYWCLSELWLALSLLFVVLAMIANITAKGKALIKIPVILFFIAALASAHPLMMLPFLFVMAYLFFNGSVGITKKQVILLTLLFIAAFLIKKFVFVSAYEDSNFGRLKHFKEYFPYWDMPINKQFVKFCLTRFYWLPIVTVLVFIVYIKQRKWLPLIVFAGGLFGYILLINVLYPDNQTEFFYVENMYMPLAVILVMPLVFDVWPYYSNKNLRVFPIVFTLIVLSAMVRIYMKHDMYSTRIAWERDFLTKHKNEKLLIAPSKVPQDTLLMSWGTPYEFWLLSTVEHGQTASICVQDHMEDMRWLERNQVKTSFAAQWGVFMYKDLPAQYFIMKDSANYYKIVE